MGVKLFSGTTQYQKFLFSPKINPRLFGLHKNAWSPWQTIGHCSWVICKQTQDRHLRGAHFFHGFLLSSINLRKASCQLLAKQNGR